MGPKYVFYLAVVPAYRKHCIEAVLKSAGDEVAFFAGDSHLDETVKTGVSERYVTRVRNRSLLGNRVLLQTGKLREALRAEVCVVDLNPRSLTAWGLALVRRILGRRTLAWGHLYPRAGANSRSAPVRLLLRRLTAGTILYGYDSVVPARGDLPRKPLWVAPNSLYPKAALRARVADRVRILYVGRLESAKNVEFLVEAFQRSNLWTRGMTLDVVGFGSLEDDIRQAAQEMGISGHVNVHGRIDDVDALADIYSESLFSVSPGYVGLSLTQSLGFGVPMLYARNEPHAPEIELARFGGTRDFSPSTVNALANAMVSFTNELRVAPPSRDDLAVQIQQFYSAESMADGLLCALRGETIDLGPDGWPGAREVGE